MVGEGGCSETTYSEVVCSEVDVWEFVVGCCCCWSSEVTSSKATPEALGWLVVVYGLV